MISHIYVTIPATYNVIVHSLQEKPKAEATLDYMIERLTECEKINLANPSVENQIRAGRAEPKDWSPRRCMVLGYGHDTTKIWRIRVPKFQKAVNCSDVDDESLLA
jgi:hypothetical protein